MHFVQCDEEESEEWDVRRSLSSEAWDEIERVLPNNLRFVNLRSLCLRDRGTKHRLSHPMFILLGRELRRLEIELKYAQSDTQNFIEDIPFVEKEIIIQLFTQLLYRCLNISELRLTIIPFPMLAQRPLCTLISELRHLTVVSIGVAPILPFALAHLASLPALEELFVHVVAEDYTFLPRGSIVRRTPSFLALRRLTIMSDCPVLAMRLLHDVQSPHVWYMALVISEHMSLQQFADLTSAVARHPSQGAIRALVIKLAAIEKLDITEDDLASAMTSATDASTLRSLVAKLTLYLERYSRPADIGSAPAISPASSLSSLNAAESVSLDAHYHAPFDDTLVAQLVRAWPHIAEISLFPPPGHPRRTHVTLAGLAPLADCLSLTRCSIALTDIDDEVLAAAQRIVRPHRGPARIESESEPSSATCPLRVLDVGLSRISDRHVPAIAAVLSAWFPQLRTVTPSDELLAASDEDEDDEAEASVTRDRQEAVAMRDRWVQVGGLVQGMATVRMQEQR